MGIRRTEYIEREALVNSFRSCGASKDLIDAIVYRINLQEAVDVVPVVRCKDCIHSYDDLCGLCCTCGPYVDCVVQPEFYCADGKKKGG